MPPSPTQAKASQAKQEQSRPPQEQTKTDEQSAKRLVSTVARSKPEIAVGYEQRLGDQDKSSSPWRDWPAWAVAVFTFGLLIVAVLQWAAMHGQRKLMGDQLASMKTTGDDTHDLAIAAQSQIELLAKHVDAAKLAADSAHHNVLVAVAQSNIARLNQRAWVGFVKIESRPSPFAIGGWLQVGVDIRNTGKTPARGITRMRVRIMPEWEPPELVDAPWQPSSIRTRAIFFPGALSHVSNYARSGNDPIVLTPDLFFEIHTGALKVFVDGRIDYSDVFGVAHWSEFRSIWNPAESVFTQCEEGNGTDDDWVETHELKSTGPDDAN
jgi:hypothetical protein